MQNKRAGKRGEKINPSNTTDPAREREIERERNLFLAWPAGDRAGLRRDLPEREAPDDRRRRRATAEREAGDVTDRRQISELGGTGQRWNRAGSAPESGNMPERGRERASGSTGRRTTHDGEISDLYGDTFQSSEGLAERSSCEMKI
jgi:hypothetical protein